MAAAMCHPGIFMYKTFVRRGGLHVIEQLHRVTSQSTLRPQLVISQAKAAISASRRRPAGLQAS